MHNIYSRKFLDMNEVSIGVFKKETLENTSLFFHINTISNYQIIGNIKHRALKSNSHKIFHNQINHSGHTFLVMMNPKEVVWSLSADQWYFDEMIGRAIVADIYKLQHSCTISQTRLLKQLKVCKLLLLLLAMSKS